MELNRRLGCQGGGDRMSDLPDHVAHHILSFLTIADLSLFGCVSKRCRQLCLSASSLSFDEESFEIQSTCSSRRRLFDSLDRMLLRRGDEKMETFRVKWFSHDKDDVEDNRGCSCDDEYFRIVSWVDYAVKCNVQELDLFLFHRDDEDIEFPSFVFLCGSLTSLRVDLSISRVLKAPSFAFSSNLKSLELIFCVIEEEFFQWISRCCKCIEKIILREIDEAKVITIESSSLETFIFVNNHDPAQRLKISGEKLAKVEILMIFDSLCGIGSLDMVAPNLKSLKLTGNLVNHCKLGKLQLLEEAYILLEPTVDDFDSMFGIFSCVCRVKKLILNEASIKVLFREGSTPAPLHNVYYLGMEIGGVSDELAPAMVSLFRGMPNLCYLSIDSNTARNETKSKASAFDAGYWKTQTLAFIHQLKEVSIELSLGSNGVQLLKSILEYAKNLEKVLIIYLPHDLEDLRTKLGNFKIISNATVVFKKKL